MFIGKSEFLKYCIWCLCITFLPFYSLVAQTDTEFWFAAPEVTAGHGDRPIYIRMTAQQTAANVIVDIPANPSFTPRTVQIPARSSATINLTGFIALIENGNSFTIENKGIHIVSDQLINAYYEVDEEFNPDIFTLKGQNALGTHFISPNQSYLGNNTNYGFNPPPFSYIIIVATANNTTVQFRRLLDANINLTTANVVLDRGQTYTIAVQKPPGSLLLTGIEIISDKDIAITIAEDSESISFCADLIGDQIVPIENLGREYIVSRGFLEPNDYIFITAVSDNTTIDITGNQNQTMNLNRGEQWVYALREDIVSISSNQKVYVLHATGRSCEVGLAIIPKLECTGSDFVRFVRSSELDMYINIIVKKGYENAFTFSGPSGDLPINEFHETPGNEDYLVSKTFIEDGRSEGASYVLANSEGYFHLGFVNGGINNEGTAVGTRYGYLSAFQQLQVLGFNANVCLGESLYLKAVGSEAYTWVVENTTYNADSISFSPQDDTQIKLVGEFGDATCKDSLILDVEVIELPDVDFYYDPLCVNTDAQFYVTDTASDLENAYWIFDDDTVVTAITDTFYFYPDIEKGAGNYIDFKLIVEDELGCRADSNLSFPIKGYDVVLDTFFEVEQGSHLLLSPGLVQKDPDEEMVAEYTYQWHPSELFVCDTCDSGDFIAKNNTRLLLNITDQNNCIIQLPIRITVLPKIFSPNAFTPDNDGVNDTFAPMGRSLEIENMQIFNRWGDMVYKGSAPWDGTSQGSLQEAGVYLFLAQVYDNISERAELVTGSFTLLR